MTVAETATIPPWTEMIIAGNMEDETMTVPYRITEPVETLTNKSNIMVAPSVVGTWANTIPLRLMIPSDDQVIMYGGTTAATICAIEAELVTSLETVDTEIIRNAKENTAHKAVPSHLQNLYQRSSMLLTKQERCQFKELLNKYQHQYAAQDEDLGKTEMAKH